MKFLPTLFFSKLDKNETKTSTKLDLGYFSYQIKTPFQRSVFFENPRLWLFVMRNLVFISGAHFEQIIYQSQQNYTDFSDYYGNPIYCQWTHGFANHIYLGLLALRDFRYFNYIITTELLLLFWLSNKRAIISNMYILQIVPLQTWNFVLRLHTCIYTFEHRLQTTPANPIRIYHLMIAKPSFKIYPSFHTWGLCKP